MSPFAASRFQCQVPAAKIEEAKEKQENVSPKLNKTIAKEVEAKKVIPKDQ